MSGRGRGGKGLGKGGSRPTGDLRTAAKVLKFSFPGGNAVPDALRLYDSQMQGYFGGKLGELVYSADAADDLYQDKVTDYMYGADALIESAKEELAMLLTLANYRAFMGKNSFLASEGGEAQRKALKSLMALIEGSTLTAKKFNDREDFAEMMKEFAKPHAEAVPLTGKPKPAPKPTPKAAPKPAPKVVTKAKAVRIRAPRKKAVKPTKVGYVVVGGRAKSVYSGGMKGGGVRKYYTHKGKRVTFVADSSHCLLKC